MHPTRVNTLLAFYAVDRLEESSTVLSQIQETLNQHGVPTYRVSIVKGRSFYGYHDALQPFVKVLLYNPQHKTKAGQLFTEGVVFGHPVSTFEVTLRDCGDRCTFRLNCSS
jgi:hypothetical protein